MNVNDLEKYYSDSFYPLSQITRDYEKSEHIVNYRCSAFPVFFTTFESLVEALDKIDNEARNEIRMRFLNALNEIQLHGSLYKRGGYLKIVEKTDNISIQDIVHLTENSSIDFFIPDLEVVLEGHDNHGFIVHCNIENKCAIDKIKAILSRCSLYLLTSPFDSKLGN